MSAFDLVAGEQTLNSLIMFRPLLVLSFLCPNLLQPFVLVFLRANTAAMDSILNTVAAAASCHPITSIFKSEASLDNPTVSMGDHQTISKLKTELSKYFLNIDSLWANMARYMCIFSGSRALEIFIPGSCDETSDFDFYVTPNIYCIVGMIQSLEQAGVIWDNPHQYIHSRLQDGGSITMSWSEAFTLIECYHIHQNTQDFSEVEVDFYTMLARTLTDLSHHERAHFVVVEAGHILTNVTVDIDSERTYDHLGGLHVTRGTINGAKVQLMHAPNTPPTHHVLRFHSSAVQCFFSPYASAHLYFDLARDKISMPWVQNTFGGVRVNPTRRYQAALKKYERRGYTIKPLEKPSRTPRNILDGIGLVFFHKHESLQSVDAVPGRLFQHRKDVLRGLSWIEANHETIPVLSANRQMDNLTYPVEQTHEVLLNHAIPTEDLGWNRPASIYEL